jgi:hypothetical protein
VHLPNTVPGVRLKAAVGRPTVLDEFVLGILAALPLLG